MRAGSSQAFASRRTHDAAQTPRLERVRNELTIAYRDEESRRQLVESAAAAAGTAPVPRAERVEKMRPDRVYEKVLGV